MLLCLVLRIPKVEIPSLLQSLLRLEDLISFVVFLAVRIIMPGCGLGCVINFVLAIVASIVFGDVLLAT